MFNGAGTLIHVPSPWQSGCEGGGRESGGAACECVYIDLIE